MPVFTCSLPRNGIATEGNAVLLTAAFQDDSGSAFERELSILLSFFPPLSHTHSCARTHARTHTHTHTHSKRLGPCVCILSSSCCEDKHFHLPNTLLSPSVTLMSFSYASTWTESIARDCPSPGSHTSQPRTGPLCVRMEGLFQTSIKSQPVSQSVIRARCYLVLQHVVRSINKWGMNGSATTQGPL